MWQPSARVYELDHLGMLEIGAPRVLCRIGGPAVGPVEQQRRAANRAPDLLEELIADVLDLPHVEMRVELPAERPVLVAVDTVDCEVARLFLCEVAVLQIGRAHV